jgi:hypothetical protein
VLAPRSRSHLHIPDGVGVAAALGGHAVPVHSAAHVIGEAGFEVLACPLHARSGDGGGGGCACGWRVREGARAWCPASHQRQSTTVVVCGQGGGARWAAHVRSRAAPPALLQAHPTTDPDTVPPSPHIHTKEPPLRPAHLQQRRRVVRPACRAVPFRFCHREDVLCTHGRKKRSSSAGGGRWGGWGV